VEKNEALVVAAMLWSWLADFRERLVPGGWIVDGRDEVEVAAICGGEKLLEIARL
jgi:hypothetical protein